MEPGLLGYAHRAGCTEQSHLFEVGDERYKAAVKVRIGRRGSGSVSGSGSGSLLASSASKATSDNGQYDSSDDG